MKLKFNRQISGAVVTVQLSLTNITSRERRALKVMGSPTIKFESAYEVSGTTVDISTTIDAFNDLPVVKFVGELETLSEVLDEVSEYIEDMHSVLCDAMSDLMCAYVEIEAIALNTSGELRVIDSVCHRPEDSCTP